MGSTFLQSNLFRTLSAFTASVAHLLQHVSQATVRYTPGVLALSACHAVSCSSSTFKSHWPLPTTLRMLGDSLYHLQIEKHEGMQASSAFTGTRKY